MNEIFFFIVILALVIMGIYSLFFSKRAIVHGLISKQKSKKIQEVTEGEFVRITGKVVFSGRILTAPLSKRKCVYYHVTVRDDNSERDAFRNFIDLEEEKASDVVIYDGERYAIINTQLVASYIEKDQEFSSGFWNISTPELKAFLKKHGERTENIMGWSLNLTAEEGVLEEGENITVAGKATWRKASDFKIKIPVEKVLYMEPLNEHGVYLTDSQTL